MLVAEKICASVNALNNVFCVTLARKVQTYIIFRQRYSVDDGLSYVILHLLDIVVAIKMAILFETEGRINFEKKCLARRQTPS